jgi:hypothetical protein
VHRRGTVGAVHETHCGDWCGARALTTHCGNGLQGTVYGLLDNVIVSPVSAPLPDRSSLPDPSRAALLVRVLVGVLTSTRGVPKVFYTRIDEIYRSILLQTGIKVPTGGCPPARVSPEQPSLPSRFRHSTRPQLR